MPPISPNPERASFIWRVISEIRISPDESQRVIPVDYLEKLITRNVLWAGDIKILLDSIEIALKKWEYNIVGLIKDCIENEYAYLLSNNQK